jgi:hypothetical protein
MKKRCAFLLLFLSAILIPLSAQQPAEAPKGGANPGRNFTIAVDPVGLALYGPSIEVGLKLLPGLYLLGIVRWEGAGLLAMTMTWGLDISTIAYGGGLRFVFEENTPGTFFITAVAQYGMGSWQDPDTSSSSSMMGRYNYIIGGVEVGYRWRLADCIVSVALIGAVESLFNDKKWYRADPSVIYAVDEEGSISPLVIPTFTLGWEL